MSEYRGVVHFMYPWQGHAETWAYVALPASAVSELEEGMEVTVILDRNSLTDTGREALKDYELFRAGLLVGGPNGTRWASDSDAAEVAIAEMRAGTTYDDDDYTATPIFMIGYVGSIDAMPLRCPEHFDLAPRKVSPTEESK